MNSNTRVAVITGASSGIGLEAAKAIAAAGYRVVAVGRSAEGSAAALKEIRAAAKGAEVEMLRADLAVMKDAARLAKDIAGRTDRIDLLLNNAGGTPREKVVTSEGNEATFTGNHLGHFLLTDRLLPLIRATAAKQPRGSVRIVNTSSSAHEYAPGLDWNDLQSLNNFITGKAYCNVKLCNVLYTRALAKRVASDGIIVHAVHPGLVGTKFASRADDAMQQYFAANADKVITAAQGADTLIWTALDSEPGKSTGGYFFERAPGTVSALGQDAAAAERLWKESEALIARANA
jgi:NAD(P)-dependent dehydrogenase (short-subunit alcohol dehydrogenase family)